MSIDTLFADGFMAEHKLSSVQAICILLLTAHNIDQSDLICVLISAAIRISQCLNLHRLGSDTHPTPSTPATSATSNKRLINREIEKRVWWYLVRYDWFQIPFQSTCQIHPTQFNTPLPVNCFETQKDMLKDGAVAAQPDEVYTPFQFSNCLNKRRDEIPRNSLSLL